MQAAVAQNQAVPITSTEESRLTRLSNGNLGQMTLYDAAVASEIAAGPWIAVSNTTTSAASPLSLATPAVNTGTCYEGVQNQKKYSDLAGETVTIDAGITGFCDGPGGTAIVARGNYDAGINPDYPDACNAAPKPVWHEQDANFVGSNPQRIEMLNTFAGGYDTPFGCGQLGNDYAAALYVTYAGAVGSYNYIGLGWGQPGFGTETFIAGPYTCCSTITNN
jgi:hypothetical protein